MNSIQTIGEKARPYLDRIETLLGERETEKGESMSRCKSINDDIKLVYGEAKESGIQIKPLKAIVKRRSLEKRIEALPAGLDLHEQQQYDTLAEAFAGTPFGEHFQQRAAETRGNGHADDRPEYQKQQDGFLDDYLRPDEEHLQQVGQGTPKRGRGRQRKNGGVIDLSL